MAIHSLHPEEQLAGWRQKRDSWKEREQMAARAKQPGQVTLYNVETGEKVYRWPVDAKGMVACGEFSYEPPEGVEPEGEASDQEGQDLGTDEDGDQILEQFPGGYYSVEKGGGWYALKDSGGQQVGKSQRDAEAVKDLLPATHRPGGEASGTTAEHSPGVPLNPDDGS